MQKIYIAALAVLCCSRAVAQKGKLKFKTINQVGLLAGASANSLQLHSVNGVSYKTFSAGIGLGFDNYYFRTIPVFLDVRKYIFKEKHTPFVYAGLGLNFPEKKENIKSQWQQSKYKGGFYCDLGIGYQVPLKGKLALNMSFGYSRKNIGETRAYRIFISPPYNEENLRKDYYDYTFRRVTVKLGLSF